MRIGRIGEYIKYKLVLLVITTSPTCNNDTRTSKFILLLVLFLILTLQKYFKTTNLLPFLLLSKDNFSAGVQKEFHYQSS